MTTEVVLKLQKNHVSEHVWRGAPDRVLSVRRGVMEKLRDPPASIVHHLELAGFAGVAHMGHCHIDHHLISALVERWRRETHTFHMLPGECTVTLEDIGMISGLPIDGRAVTGDTVADWDDICRNLLGTIPPKGEMRGANLSLRWLRDRFHHVPVVGVDRPDYIAQYARAYIMRLIGNILCPDYSGSYVHLMYLPLLEDFNIAGSYSWGSAVLAYLYRELCKATSYSAKEIGGACIILQFWAWHRFPGIAPQLLDDAGAGAGADADVDPDPNPAYSEERLSLRPLGFRWRSDKGLPCSPQHTLGYYRYFFDTLEPDEIVWRPYADIVPPDFCTRGEGVWQALVPMVIFYIVEYHQPNRVMRQFGLNQDPPGKSQQPDDLHSVTLSGKSAQRWPDVHKDEILKWEKRNEHIQEGTPLLAPLTSTSDYMKWYKGITRRWIGRSSSTLGRALDLVEQLHISSGAPSPEFTSDSAHSLTTEILAAFREHNCAFRRQLSQPAPPTQRVVQPPPEEAEEDDGRGRRRRRTRSATTRTRLRDNEPSSPSSEATQSSTPTPSLQQQQHPAQQQFLQPSYFVLYQAPPSHTGAVGSSSSSSTAVPPPPFPYQYPYYQFPPQIAPPPPPPPPSS